METTTTSKRSGVGAAGTKKRRRKPPRQIRDANDLALLPRFLSVFDLPEGFQSYAELVPCVEKPTFDKVGSVTPRVALVAPQFSLLSWRDVLHARVGRDHSALQDGSTAPAPGMFSGFTRCSRLASLADDQAMVLGDDSDDDDAGELASGSAGDLAADPDYGSQDSADDDDNDNHGDDDDDDDDDDDVGAGDDGGSGDDDDLSDGELVDELEGAELHSISQGSWSIVSAPSDATEEAPAELLSTLLDRIRTRLRLTVVLMCHGGYFAGGVFLEGRPIVHKIFRRYVTRRKQGQRQANRDAHGVKHAASAGRGLRRYNEVKHAEEIADLCQAWQEHITNATAVAVHAPGRVNQHYFFGPRAPLRKTDPRLVPVRMVTHRPSYSEVRRVFQHLSGVTLVLDPLPQSSSS